jgi:hypothetical protein
MSLTKRPKAHERLLHFLVAVKPFFFARAEVGHPAVGQFLGGVVKAAILAFGEGVMVDGRLDEVARRITLVVAARGRATNVPAIPRGGARV